MNAVGIDVSKGKSMVAVMRPCGEVALAPFEVSHTDSALSELAKTLKNLPGETRVVMEHTGYYHAPVALALCEAGLYVSVVNPLLRRKIVWEMDFSLFKKCSLYLGHAETFPENLETGVNKYCSFGLIIVPPAPLPVTERGAGGIQFSLREDTAAL